MPTHKAELKVEWNGSFNGRGLIQSPGLTTAVSLPSQFGGLGVGASPEDLFLSSIASCYAITLGIILQKANVAYQGLTIDGVLVTQTGPPAAIEEVILTVHIATEDSQEKLEQLAARVDGFCLIAKVAKGNLKKTVHIVRQSLPEVSHAPI